MKHLPLVTSPAKISLSPAIKHRPCAERYLISYGQTWRIKMLKHYAVRFILCLLVILTAGCAGTVKYQEYPMTNGDSNSTSTLYIIRPYSSWGATIRTPIYVNTQLIGRLGPGGYIETKIPPGKSAVSVTTSDVIIDVEENRQYFVKVTMPFQVWFMTPAPPLCQCK
ncbi:MAG: DUF2846 domain-containing protein [Thermodesulfobacteriota bacterium]